MSEREAIDELIDAIDRFRKVTEDGIDVEMWQMRQIEVDADMIASLAAQVQIEILQAARKAYKATTPIDTGNLRSSNY